MTDVRIEQLVKNDFVTRCFRDNADHDYIAARVLYRQDLAPQFLWAGLQAVEKYIKAILLYSDVSAQGLGHNLTRAAERIRQKTDSAVPWSEELDQFLEYLAIQGANRYFTYPAYALGRELLRLDWAVWVLRRHCLPSGVKVQYPVPRVLFRKWESGAVTDVWPLVPKDRYQIPGGRLETILDRGPATMRAGLVWHNFYFGRRRRKQIRGFRVKAWSANPTHYLHPEIFDWIETKVDLPEGVRLAFRSPGRTKSGRPQ